MRVVDYLRSKGKTPLTAKWECLVFDLTNRVNLGDNDSGLGFRDGSFKGDTWKPQQKTWKKRLGEILLWLKSKIMLFVISTQQILKKMPLIVIQLDFWWWWWFSEEEKREELTKMKYRDKTEEQKKVWTKWNKELNELSDKLVNWLNESSLRWIFVADEVKDGFKKDFPYQFREDLTEHDKDCLVLVWAFHERKLGWIEGAKKKQGADYYWSYCQKDKEYILNKRKINKPLVIVDRILENKMPC